MTVALNEWAMTLQKCALNIAAEFCITLHRFLSSRYSCLWNPGFNITHEDLKYFLVRTTRGKIFREN
jgi:hypothetical protein